MTFLPGIVSIRYTECQNIQPHVMMQSIAGAIIDIALPTTQIKFYGTPKCKWNKTIENGTPQEKLTLEFNTADIIPEGLRLAFIIKIASGRQFLIGSREPKYPQIEFEENTGSTEAEAALRTYKISHVALKSVLPCIL